MPDQKTKFDDGTWKHEIRKISDLHPNPDNTRVITKETLKGLKKSMAKNGYTHVHKLGGFEKLAEWGLI